jgi:hypothetical protein
MLTIETFKRLMGSQPSWFDEWLGFLTPQIATVSDLCAANPTDPGPPPAPISVPAFGLPALPNPAFFNWALQKMQYYEFTQVCVCNAGSPPTCNDVTPYSGSPTAFSTGPHTLGVEFTANTPGPLGQVAFDVGTGWTPNAQLYLWDAATTSLIHTELVTHTWVSGHNVLTLATPQTLTVGHNYFLTIDYAGGNWQYYAPPSAQTGDTRFTPIQSGQNPGFGTYPLAVSTEWYAMYPILCSLAPTPAVVPTQPSGIILPPPLACSTNGDICAILNQIQSAVQATYQLQTLMQRRETPFAWIAGTPVPVTGHGTLAVQDIIAVAVAVTAHPGTWGYTSDTPPRFIPMLGEIQASDGTLYQDFQQVHYLSMIVPIPSWATRVAYSFKPGVSVTLTPLSPEP